MQADKVPHTYAQHPFKLDGRLNLDKLDGRLNLDISFGDHTMTTPVYIKMDAHNQLLLSEGVCRQLGIIHYRPNVERRRGGRKTTQPASHPSHKGKPKGNTLETIQNNQEQEAVVSMVHVNLLQYVYVLPHKNKVVEVTLCDTADADGS